MDSTEKMDVMHSTGADQVIDYTQQDFTRNNQRYDLILDMQAHHPLLDYKRVLNPGGSFIMVGGSMALVYKLLLLGRWFSMTENKNMGLLLHKPNKGLDTMNALFESGKVIPIIDRCYPLTDVADALRYFGDGHVKGKIIIILNPGIPA